MISVAWLFGFLIAAAMGTIATAATAAELQQDAASWANGTRWAFYKQRHRWQKANLLKTLFGLHTIEILVICGVIWLLGLFFALAASEQRPYNQYSFEYVFGSMVGAAAAPWVWLHFARTFEYSGRRERRRRRRQKSRPGSSGRANKEKISAAESLDFSRYRFITYLLAVAVLIAVLQPYLGRWLPNVQKFGALGVEVTLSSPGRNERGTALLSVGGGQSAEPKDTAGRLSTATRRAYQVGSGLVHNNLPTELSHIKLDMEGFANLSLINRDKVYIAYFYRERNAWRSGVISNPTISDTPVGYYVDLSQYVDSVPFPSKYHGSQDQALLEGLSPTSLCASFYADQLRDFRLFLVDTGDFLRPLLVDVARQWTLSRSKEVEAQPLETKYAKRFIDQVQEALSHRPQFKNINCAIKNEPIGLSGVGQTPYPAVFIAHYLAAIDSVESGVVVMTDWLQYQRDKTGGDAAIRRDPEQGWYAVRAMLTASQLPYLFGGSAPAHRAQVQFQEQMTDRMAELLDVAGGQSWRSLCDRLARPGLHPLIGRHLAFTYADERNYLFEILGPEDFGNSRSDSVFRSTNSSLLTFLNEAEAIIERPDCFVGVRGFSGQKEQLIGVYHLNAAYLLYWLRITADSAEKNELTRRIRRHLDQAKSLAGDDNDRNSLDLLRRGNEFERHRLRLGRLERALDRETEKE